MVLLSLLAAEERRSANGCTRDGSASPLNFRLERIHRVTYLSASTRTYASASAKNHATIASWEKGTFRASR